ncbi:hypothetical protein ACIRSS_14880 [Amycolatopsis sp. NPDC101161]|uniref:hypothetical protein n=1 Tax=Amycolatopsis sp. NPDC101161 TaxID=3363940 RepID=UPI00381FCEDE
MGADLFLHALVSSGATSGLAELAANAFKRLRRDQPPPSSTVPSVAEAQQLVTLAEEILQLTVTVERAQGTSWEAIGRTLGITRSTAHGRFSADSSEDVGPAEHERELADKVDALFDIAEKAKRPVTNSAAHLNPAARHSLLNSLEQLAHDPRATPDTKVRAAQLIVGLTPEIGEKSLRELTESYRRTRPSDEPEVRVTKGSPYTRFLEQLTAESRVDSSVSEEEVDFLITSYRTVLDRLPPHAPMSRPTKGNLASALLTRFAQRGDSNSLNEAITLLRAILHETDNERERGDTLVSLASALLERFRITSDHEDLSQAQDILLFNVGPNYHFPHSEAFIRFVESLQTLVAITASKVGWRETEWAFRETLSRLEQSSDTPQAAALVVCLRLQLACIYLERGEVETGRDEVQRALLEADRYLPTPHPLKNLARQLQVMTLLELNRGGDEIPEVLDVLDALSRDIRAPHEPRR